MLQVGLLVIVPLPMVIKESSDELNPTVVTAADLKPEPRVAHSAKDYLALAIATCGVGYLPLAPGTWGSLVAVAFYFFLRRIWFPHSDLDLVATGRTFVVVEVIVIATVTVVGTWASSRTEQVLKLKDPGKVVIDEVAGQLIALLAVPITFLGPPYLVVLAFILFRFFDIVKPYPARRMESLHGGLGIMADDIVAGVYAAIVVAVVVVISWLI